MNEVIIAAIFAGLGSVITIIGKVIIDIIRAKKEPDQADLELKDQIKRDKDKNDAAIGELAVITKELKDSIEEINSNLTKKFDEVNRKIESNQEEMREINKSELRHQITEIYFEHLEDKTLDLRTKDDLCSLYTAYSSIGGNSFAHELYDEMMDWKIK